MAPGTNDTGWPVGYPALITKEYEPSDQAKRLGFIKINIGDQVKVVQPADHFGNIGVQYPRDSNGNKGPGGWVGQGHVEIGAERKIGDPIVFEIGEPQVPTLPTGLVPNQGGLLRRTIVGLLRSYCENADTLPTSPPYVTQRLGTTQRVDDFADKIINGIRAVSSNLLQLLDSGDFSIYGLRDASKSAESSSDTGIYGIMYSGFVNDAKRRPELYVGSTEVSFADRYKTHVRERNKETPKGVHYRAAKASTVRQPFKLCILKGDDLDVDGQNLKLVEQVMVDLLGTTCSNVLDLQVYTETDDDDGDDEVESSHNEEQLSKIARYTTQKDEAQILLKLAHQVFAQTGWKGGVRRKKGKDFGCVAGLNWRMPLTELRKARDIWTKNEIPGKIATFRRIGCRVRQHGKSKVVWQKNKPDKTNFQFYLAEDMDGPEYNTMINIIFEIYLDGTRHPFPLSLAPTIGCFSDWNDALTIGMRIEWQDSHGNWLYRYVQLSNSYNIIVSGADNGATTGYVLATGMRAFFMQQRRKPTDSMPWIWDFGIALVREVKVDHLRQMIITREVQNITNQSPVVKKSLDTIGRELEALGAERAAKSTDTSYPILPFGLKKLNQGPGRGRTSCDWCFVMYKAGHHIKGRCNQDSDDQSCEQCTRFARPCTFTQDSTLNQAPALQAASHNPLAVIKGVKKLQPRILMKY